MPHRFDWTNVELFSQEDKLLAKMEEIETRRKLCGRLLTVIRNKKNSPETRAMARKVYEKESTWLLENDQ